MSGTPDLDEAAPSSQIQPWGKLISLNGAKVNSSDLCDNEVSIGRNPSNSITINDPRLSGNHCKFKWNQEQKTVQIQDLSTNGTFLGDQKIGKNNEVLLKDGDEIYLLHKSKVPITEIIGFTFIFKQPQEVKGQLDEQQQKKMQMMEDLQEDIHCPICDDVIYQCVCLIPCLHNFCGACFSDWMAKQKTCPTCRKDVQQVNKNPTINNLVEKYLQMHPDKKRPAEEYKFMDDKNQIKGDGLVFNSAAPLPPPVMNDVPTNAPPARGRGRGRGVIQQQPPPPPQPQVVQRQLRQSSISDYSAEDDGPVTRDCVTCIQSINGYQCQKKAAHLNCTNCQSKMPRFDLNEKRLVFRCTLCQRFYCSLYNKNCQILNNKNPNIRLVNHTVPTTVDIQCFRQNYFEHKAFLDYLKDKNITTQDIFQYMITNHISKGQFRYIESKKTLANPVRDVDLVIRDDTPVCTLCFGMIWQQIIFRYRIAIRDLMPLEVKARGACWFGINCKTMTHNQEHAKKLDHIGEQTKF